jgi:predicted Zn-dependent protease
MKTSHSGRAFHLAVLFLGGIILGGCLRNPVTQRRETKLISEAAEREIGRESREKIVKDYGEFAEPAVGDYVVRLGRRLVAVSDRPKLDFQFTVLDSDIVNAFAAPGGYIFVTRGLLERSASEAELASVLGHEIAHVCAWHSIGAIQRQMGLGAVTLLGAIASGVGLGPEAMLMVAQTADLFSSLYLLGYTRENELEADHVGLRYMMSAGYDPRAALSFFRRLEALEKAQGEEAWEPYLRSHPPTPDRIRLAERFIDRMSAFARTPTPGLGDFAAVKDRLPRLSPEERGLTQGRVFEQKAAGLRMEIPEGWSWEAAPGRGLVAFRRDAGDAWGELRLYRLDGSTATATADGVLRHLAETQKWKPLQSRPVLYPAGYGTLAQYIGSAGALGGVFQLRVFAVVRGGSALVLLTAAPPERFEDYLVPFEQILRTLTTG